MSDQKSMKLFKIIANNWQNFINEQEIPASIKRLETYDQAWEEVLSGATSWLHAVDSKISKNIKLIKKKKIDPANSKLVFDGRRLYWLSNGAKVKSWRAVSGKGFFSFGGLNKEAPTAQAMRALFYLKLIDGIRKVVEVAGRNSKKVAKVMNMAQKLVGMTVTDDDKTKKLENGVQMSLEDIWMIIENLAKSDDIEIAVFPTQASLLRKGIPKEDEHGNRTGAPTFPEAKKIIEKLVAAVYAAIITGSDIKSNKLAVEAFEDLANSRAGYNVATQIVGPERRQSKRDKMGGLQRYQKVKKKGPIPEGKYLISHKLQEAPTMGQEHNNIFKIMAMILAPSRIIPANIRKKIKRKEKVNKNYLTLWNTWPDILNSWGPEDRRIFTEPRDVPPPGAPIAFGLPDRGKRGQNSAVPSTFAWGRFRWRISSIRDKEGYPTDQDERMFRYLDKKEKNMIRKAYKSRRGFYIHGGDFGGTSGCIKLLGDQMEDFAIFYTSLQLKTAGTPFVKSGMSIPLYVKYTSDITDKVLSVGAGAIEKVIFNLSLPEDIKKKSVAQDVPTKPKRRGKP